MKKRCRSAWFLFFSLPLTLWLGSHSGVGAADTVEAFFPEFYGLIESFQGRMDGAEILQYSSAADPVAVGCLALGATPWLDLIDKKSYSLKFSLPLTWRSYSPHWHHEAGYSLGAGFLASLQLKSLPPRLGSWRLNTGLFYIRKDPISLSQVVHAVNSENGGGIGAINISIVY
jgi:hypothetical protein